MDMIKHLYFKSFFTSKIFTPVILISLLHVVLIPDASCWSPQMDITETPGEFYICYYEPQWRGQHITASLGYSTDYGNTMTFLDTLHDADMITYHEASGDLWTAFYDQGYLVSHNNGRDFEFVLDNIHPSPWEAYDDADSLIIFINPWSCTWSFDTLQTYVYAEGNGITVDLGYGYCLGWSNGETAYAGTRNDSLVLFLSEDYGENFVEISKSNVIENRISLYSGVEYGELYLMEWYSRALYYTTDFGHTIHYGGQWGFEEPFGLGNIYFEPGWVSGQVFEYMTYMEDDTVKLRIRYSEDYGATWNEPPMGVTEKESAIVQSCSIVAWPNPVNSVIHLQLPSAILPVHIYNICGRLVYKHLPDSRSYTSLDLQQLPSGTYLVVQEGFTPVKVVLLK